MWVKSGLFAPFWALFCLIFKQKPVRFLRFSDTRSFVFKSLVASFVIKKQSFTTSTSPCICAYPSSALRSSPSTLHLSTTLIGYHSSAGIVKKNVHGTKKQVPCVRDRVAAARQTPDILAYSNQPTPSLGDQFVRQESSRLDEPWEALLGSLDSTIQG